MEPYELRRGFFHLMFVCAGLLTAGCGGVHLHRPDDAAAASGVVAALKDSKLAEGLANERKAMEAMNRRDEESMRQYIVSAWDMALVQIIADGQVSSVRRELDRQLIEVAGKKADELRDILSKQRQLRFREGRVDLAARQYVIVAKSRKPPVCPYPSADPPFEGVEAPILYRNFKRECDALIAESKSLDALLNDGLLKIKRAELRSLREEESAVDAEVQSRKKEFIQAKDEYERLVKAADRPGLAVELADKAQRLKDALERLGKVISEVESSGVTKPVQEFSLEGVAERASIQQKNIDALLAALQGRDPKAAAPPEIKPLVLIASAVKGFESAFSPTVVPDAVAVLVQTEYLQLEAAGAELARKRATERTKALQRQVDALVVQTAYLVNASNALDAYAKPRPKNAGACAPSFVEAAQPNADCGDQMLEALINMMNAQRFGRAEYYAARIQGVGIDHEIAVDASETALAEKTRLVTVPVESLAALHQGGIKAEDLANLIHAIGLSAIAVRVK